MKFWLRIKTPKGLACKSKRNVDIYHYFDANLRAIPPDKMYALMKKEQTIKQQN